MHVVIIGNGISGITTARHLRKIDSNCKITVVSAETDYFFSRTALMYIYMGHMQFEQTKPYENWFWKKNRIDLVRGKVHQIDFGQQVLHFDENFSSETTFDAPPANMSFDKLVLALGSASNMFGWPGQDLNGVGGLYSYDDLVSLEHLSGEIKHGVIVGGGLIGIELAEMLHSRHIPVSLLVREKSYWSNVLPQEESKLVSQHIRDQGIDLRLGEELKEIIDNGQGSCEAIMTKSDQRIDCQYVGLTAGVHPNVHWLKAGELEINKGILVNNRLETNLRNVYAIGDCAELRKPQLGRRPIEAIWYTGRMMGETLAHVIAGHDANYDPGIWFNSAKFFDIEYQVYGEVPADIPEHLNTIYWQHPDENIAIRINYNKNDHVVVGFNVMGIRLRHEVCEKWIKSKADIEYVLENFPLANFDPEFYKQFHNELIAKYGELTGKKVLVKSKRSLSSVLSFLKSN